ncbi:MAG: hypothetical protein HYX83_01045 [Chloroflexi bacterium]|nr:hypothetical protein [Chloroflexota bacterium]
MRRFGSIQAVRDASIEELAATSGMNKSAAQKIKSLL